VRRIVGDDRYDLFRDAARAVAYQDLDVLVPEEQARALEELRASDLVDGYYLDEMRSYALYTADPSDARYRSRSEMHRVGWYVPEDRVFPLGDNRDNSRDARSFGAVHTDNVLGRAMFRYWPVGRIGAIH
jgi:signal peptidase I